MESVTVQNEKISASYHNAAMLLCEDAQKAIKNQLWREVADLLDRAYKLELSAADVFRADYSMEPSRSILYKSAAGIAISCGKARAKAMLIDGFESKAPEQLILELRAIGLTL